jgi:predicted ArsR family transcriptional regulator
VVELMDTLGFAPETRREADRVRLTECPLLESARAHPDVVCNVHSGLVRGALAELGDETTEVELEPFAEPGACLLRMREQAR